MNRPRELAFVGDVCLAMGWPGRMREHDALYPFENVADLLEARTFMYGSYPFEPCVTLRYSRTAVGYTFLKKRSKRKS